MSGSLSYDLDIGALDLDIGALDLDIGALDLDIGALDLDIGASTSTSGVPDLDVGVPEPDADEELELGRVPLPEAIGRVQRGERNAGKSALAMLRAQYQLRL